MRASTRGAADREPPPPDGGGVVATAVTPTLQPYLPRLVLEWQEVDPEARFWEVEGSMVFVDVSGFTKMSERLARQGKVGAEEVSDVIDETFSSLLAAAYANGGSLIKFGGDALLLFFGGVDHAPRAVASAHGMRAELRRIGTFATSAGKVTLRMSVGAHTGLFHFFLVGDSHRDLIVAGPAATETVTMEGAASAGQILLSPALAATLPEANRGRVLGPGVLLRGTPPPVESIPVERVTTDLDLTHFVSRGLQETLRQGEIEPEHRFVTIAFVHYGGFDDLVRGEGPAAAAAALEALVVASQRAVDARGVVFLATDVAPDGGKIILTAGAPVVTGADEEGMLLAVRDIVAADITLPLRIGVNTGPVFAGAIGPSYRRTYTVMGDAVNLAARLMAKAEHGQVVATPQVIDGSRTLFDVEALEPFFVKGKKQPIDAFVVGEPRGSRTSIAEAGLPLIGRDDELATLEGAWSRARAGEGAVVELSAEPGMGKSRLLQELLGRIGDVDVLRGECRLYQAATPYFPFRALLRTAFGLDGLGDDNATAALAALVDERAPALAPWLSLIATPLDLELPPSREVEELEDEFRRARLEQAVTELLAAVVVDPTVILVEDTHWMDEPSRDLLARLTGSLDGRPWLLLLSTRPAERGEDEDDGVARIELGPLDPSHAAALIDAATEDEPLMPQQVRTLAERAAGNPLFLLELLDALRRGEDVDALPHSVEGLIQARIDRLPPADRTHLREVSVLGAGFRVEHVASALADGGSTTRARAALDRLGDFLAVDAKGWAQFHHALIRDAAYEGLPFRRRRELHARVGDSILAAAGDAPEEQAELLSLHYSAAGRWEDAWTYSRIAGDAAREVYANVEAARFYERALAAGSGLDVVGGTEPVEVAVKLAEVREHAGLFDAALDGLDRARRLAGDDPLARADIRYRRARVLMRTGAFRTAYRETMRGYRSIEAQDGSEPTRARARLIRLSSALRLMEGRPSDARVLAERAAAEAETVGDRLELANAYAVLDGALVDLGEGERAGTFADKAVEIYSALGDLPGLGTVEVSIGVRGYSEGRWDDAVAAYVRAQKAFQRAGNETQAALAAGNIGEVLVSQGRFAEAEPLLAETIRVLRAHASVGPALFCQMQIGRLQLGVGAFEEAATSFVRTRDEAAAIGIRGLALEAGIHLAAALTRQGDHDRALAVLDAESERAGELVAALGGALACARAETLVALGRLDEASAIVAAGLAASAGHEALYDRARLLVLEGRLARARGDSGAEALQEAEGLLQRLGVIAVPCFYGNAR